jgi:hypothetical protein
LFRRQRQTARIPRQAYVERACAGIAKVNIIKYLNKLRGLPMLSKRKCKRIEPLLWGYAAARLPEAETARVQRHLNTCKDCREQMKAYGQTVEGVAILRVRPVPVSLSNWQDVQRRLDTTPPVPARLSPLFSFRAAVAGFALAGMACLLVGIMTARKQGTSATEEAELSSLVKEVKEQSGVKPFKKYSHFSKRFIAESSDAARFGNKYGNKWMQGEDRTAPTPFFVQADMPAPIKKLHVFRRNGHYRIAARRRHHKYLHSSYQLARRSEQKAPIVQPVQIVSLSPDMSAPVPQFGVEREQPEYVLTTIVDSGPRPRDFVMDTMTADAQNVGSTSYSSCNTSDNENGKEIRGW